MILAAVIPNHTSIEDTSAYTPGGYGLASFGVLAAV